MRTFSLLGRREKTLNPIKSLNLEPETLKSPKPALCQCVCYHFGFALFNISFTEIAQLAKLGVHSLARIFVADVDD